MDVVPVELRPGKLRPGKLRPGKLRPGELRPGELGTGKRRTGKRRTDEHGVDLGSDKFSAIKLPLISSQISILQERFKNVDPKMIENSVYTAIGKKVITEDNAESITNDAASIIESSIIYKDTILSELQETFPGVVGIDSMIDKVFGATLINSENIDDIFNHVSETIVGLRKEGAEEILGKNGFPVTEENIQATTETMIQLQRYFLEKNPDESIDKYVYGAMDAAISTARGLAGDSQQILDLALNIVGAQIICDNFVDVKQIGEACLIASQIISRVELPEGATLSESCFFTVAKCVVDIFDDKQRPYDSSLLQQKIFERTSKQTGYVDSIIEQTRFEQTRSEQTRSEHLGLVEEEMSSDKSDLLEETIQKIAEAKTREIAEANVSQIRDELIMSAIISAATKILKRDKKQEQEQEQELELSLDELFEISVETIVNGDEITIPDPFEKAEKKDDISKAKSRSYEVVEVEDYVPEPINPSILSDEELDKILNSAIDEIMTATMESDNTENEKIIQTIQTIQADNSVFDRLNTLVKQQETLLDKFNSFTPESLSQEPLSQKSLSQGSFAQGSFQSFSIDRTVSGESSKPRMGSSEVLTEEKKKFIGEEEKTIKKTWRTLYELTESLDPSQPLDLSHMSQPDLESYKSLRQTYTIVSPGANINMASLFAEDDAAIVKPVKRQGADGDSSDSEDEDSPDRGPPSSPPNTFLVDQGGDGVCFILAVLYIICKLFFTLFAILYPRDIRFVKPSAFTPDQIKILNATITVNGTIDPDELNALLSLLLVNPQNDEEPQNYVYNIAVVYVFLFMIAINLMNDKNGEDPSKGGYAVSSLLLMIHFLYTIIAEEPELSEDDEENFDHFEKFYKEYITQSSSKKLKYPHNYYAYKLLVFMMKRVKYGEKPVPVRLPVQGPPPVRLPVPGCPVLKVAGDDIKNPLGKLNEITINQLVAHNKKMGFLTSYCALGINHELFDALYQFLVILGKMRLNKKKIVTNHEQIIAGLEKVKERHIKYQALIPTLNLPPSNTRGMLDAVEKYISAAKTDIDSEIAKQKLEIADLNARLKIKKKPFIDKFEQVKRDNEAENHVVTLVVRVDGDVQYFRLMNTWTGKYKTPWFEADFLWKYMGVSNVFNDFRVSVVSCAFLFTPGNEISNRVLIEHVGTAVSVPLESPDVSLCKQLYVSVVTGDQKLFDSVISNFVNGRYYAHKIVKSPECKRMINGIIRHLIGTAEVGMLLAMINAFGKAMGYQIYDVSHEYSLWSYPARSEQLGYLSARVLATYTAFHSCVYGSRNVTIISPKSIDVWIAFAQNCIESAIDGEEYAVPDIYSVQLWLLWLYMMQLFRSLFNGYEEARSEYPGSAHSVLGPASGKLCVIPRRSSIFTTINGELTNTYDRHYDAESTVGDFIGRIEFKRRHDPTTGDPIFLDPKAEQQLRELREMWRKISESLEREKIPVDDFDASIRILSELIRNFERVNVTFPLPSLDSASAFDSSTLSISSQSSQDSSQSVIRDTYGKISSVYDSSQEEGMVIAPPDAKMTYGPQSFGQLGPSVSTNKDDILQSMYDELYKGEGQLDFSKMTVEQERNIVDDYVDRYTKNGPLYIQYYNAPSYGGSRRKVFQRRTKKQKNDNNKKYKKTKIYNKNNNKKRSRKPSKKRHPLKTNANTKRKKC